MIPLSGRSDLAGRSLLVGGQGSELCWFCVCRTGCRPPPPLPLRVAKAGRNHLNVEIISFLFTGKDKQCSCVDVNSPCTVNESAELWYQVTQGAL
jgi:hypothetical protein